MTAQSDHMEQDGELDRGPHTTRERERLCVATRAVQPISDLIRFVVGPGGEAIPDIKCKLPGRGVWVTATRQALEEAIKRKAFARGFKRDIRLPMDLAGRTDRLLEQSALDALAIAGKAGLVAAGFGKAAAALGREDAVALLHAADASPEGVRKLRAIVRRGPSRPLPVIEFLTSAQLDLALGRPNVVHAALLAGAASDTFLSRSRRLERFRTGGAGDRGNRAGEAAPH
jgi:predicted RNA-binding protein YlxR (DUF448 family)